MDNMIIALILFAITYVLMLAFGKFRTYIALCSGLIFLITGMLSFNENLFVSVDRIDEFGKVVTESAVIDFNVLLMIAGSMGLVQLFIDSKMPDLLAEFIIKKVKNVQMAAVALALFAGIISAFVDNVATVLMVAPVAIQICKKLNTNPVPFIIAIAVSSNLQGAATLVGDTTAIMLGGEAGMSFLDFFWYEGKPSIFFAVELGAIASALILAFIFRKEKQPIPKQESNTKVTDYVPTVLLLAMLGLLIGASFIESKPDITNGLICCALFVVGLVYNLVKYKSKDNVIGAIKAIDFDTLGLLLGLFLMIGGIKEQGVIAAAADLLAKLGGGNEFLLFTIIVWASVLISAFIDNIPYVATMLPIITGLGLNPTLLYFGLLSGATLGGNCTPIGASANITGTAILRKNGYEVKNKDFFKIGIPFTLAAVISAYIYLWVVYGTK